MVLSFVKKYPIISFVLLCLLPVHGILWPLRLSGVSPETLQPLKIIFAFLPTAAAFLITMAIQGEDGVRALWKKTFLRKDKIKFYSLALMGIAILGALALLIRFYYDGYAPPAYAYQGWGEMLIIAPFLLLFPGFTEEYGWRGFLQERLQDKKGVFLASLITGLVWGFWHAMDFLMGNYSSETSTILLFFAYIVATSIIVGSIYVASGGSIFVAMLAHFSANIANSFLPIWTDGSSPQTPILFVSLLWVVAIAILVYELRGGFKGT